MKQPNNRTGELSIASKYFHKQEPDEMKMIAFQKVLVKNKNPELLLLVKYFTKMDNTKTSEKAK